MNEDASEPVLAKGTWFKEDGKKSHQGGTFRMVLYGFLVRARAAEMCGGPRAFSIMIRVELN
jgi:hypothetical protein